jgi:ribonucleoside-triphosphate reductase
MNPKHTGTFEVGGNGVGPAGPDDVVLSDEQVQSAAGANNESRFDSSTTGYASFRELPTITHVCGGIIVALGLAALVLTLFEIHSNGLLWLFFYSIPANTAISVFPHEPVIVYTGQYFHPMVVAMVALAGNLAAGYVDYHFFTPVLRMKFSAGYRKTKSYQRAIRWFDMAPFWAVVIFALTPLPFYLVKFLVFSTGYSMSRYMLAIAVGRLPRFYVLALLGVVLHIPVWLMVAIFSLIFAVYILFIVRGFWRKRSDRRATIQTD